MNKDYLLVRKYNFHMIMKERHLYMSFLNEKSFSIQNMQLS